MSFNQIVGHESIKKQIETSIRKGMFSHAHLIIGEDGIGKSILARNIGLSILEKEVDREYADLIEYRVPSNKQSMGIKDVTGKIMVEIYKKPYEGDKKVIIIYEADKMTVDAQNAFLKTIEEPPKGVFIILLCENLQAILETIRSRCQIHKLERLNFAEMKYYLNNRYPMLKDEEIKRIIAFSDGIPGRADRFIEDEEFKEIRNLAINLLIDVNNKDTTEFLKYEQQLLRYKNNSQEILTWILACIRDAMVYKETGSSELIISQDKIQRIKDMAAMFSFNRLNDIIYIVNETRQKLDRNVNPSLSYTNMLLKFLDT